MVLSSSPKSVSFLGCNGVGDFITRRHNRKSSTSSHAKEFGPITLAELIDALPPILRQQKIDGRKSLQERIRQDESRGTEDDPIQVLFGRLDLSLGEWRKYAIFDNMKNYTRNLIATDDVTFTLLLLCWNTGKESPIHDHPSDGCWLRVCEGEIRETRYAIDVETDSMTITSDEVFGYDAPAFIKDSMGYHKVGNPSKSTSAVTLHLYCPPFSQCKIWLDSTHASKPSNACMCNYSEYGVVKHTCDMMSKDH